MAVRDKVSSLRSALWAGAGLVVALLGLFMSMHESGAHATCVSLARGLPRGVHQTGLDCGFTDTVYWAGVVILVTGTLSFVAIAASGISTAVRIRGANASSNGRAKGLKTFGNLVDPTDPATRWQLDPATDWRPGSAGWQAGPNAAIPFVPPIRHDEDVGVASFAQSNKIASPPLPAWYADPERQGAIRWWDGQSWGESRPNPQ